VVASRHTRGPSAPSAIALAILALVAGACRSRSRQAASDAAAISPSGSASAAAMPTLVDAGPMASGIPLPAASVEAEINPTHAPAYSGPTGALTGVVHASGDAPAARKVQIPFECGEAYATYGKAFREGNGRTLADVLVAITEYRGFVPAATDVAAVKIHGCAFDTRTVALAFGQRIEVSNDDASQFFLPALVGAEMPAQIVAVPHGDPVRLYPLRVGHYALADGMNRTWMYADVFVLRYATHAVTGLDGRYRIGNIPVGKVKVSAYLPAIDAGLHPDVGMAHPTMDAEIEIKAGETATLDFVIPYQAPKPVSSKPMRPTGPPIR
jgi:hypothetical protein